MIVYTFLFMLLWCISLGNLLLYDFTKFASGEYKYMKAYSSIRNIAVSLTSCWTWKLSMQGFNKVISKNTD